jgi:hypothetical protein
VTQMVEHLPSKREALSSNPNTVYVCGGGLSTFKVTIWLPALHPIHQLSIPLSENFLKSPLVVPLSPHWPYLRLCPPTILRPGASPDPLRPKFLPLSVVQPHRSQAPSLTEAQRIVLVPSFHKWGNRGPTKGAQPRVITKLGQQSSHVGLSSCWHLP